MRVAPEKVRAGAWGVFFTGILALLIVVGSLSLDHFDATLVGYTFATLFATFGIIYRYAMWLQRPPTHSTGDAGGRSSRRHDSSIATSASFCVASSASSPPTSSFSVEVGCGGWRTG
jgi:amino acid permease